MNVHFNLALGARSHRDGGCGCCGIVVTCKVCANSYTPAGNEAAVECDDNGDEACIEGWGAWCWTNVATSKVDDNAGPPRGTEMSTGMDATLTYRDWYIPSESGGGRPARTAGPVQGEGAAAAVFDAVVPNSSVAQTTLQPTIATLVTTVCVCGVRGVRGAAAGKQRAAAWPPVWGPRHTSPEGGR